LTITTNETEAELVCGLLRASDIVCMHRITDIAFGSGGELASSGLGPREVLVRPHDLTRAQAVVAEAIEGAAE
ncbi:MAG: putative prokaryotic signal transducing protein, partial [Thermoleophilia bacterium]|nr:putative prokaryotic signal transducing protein [Thermoleophilia bacterium]